MSSIIVKTSELREILRQIGNDQMHYVEFMILDEEELDGEKYPPCLSIHAISKVDTAISVDYGEIDAVILDN